jgi:hypothetical protein
MGEAVQKLVEEKLKKMPPKVIIGPTPFNFSISVGSTLISLFSGGGDRQVAVSKVGQIQQEVQCWERVNGTSGFDGFRCWKR